MTPEDIARRFDNRPGYELITYREVGLPLFNVYATALMLERQERSCIDEFTLKAISSGLDEMDDIEGILGLPNSVVTITLAELLRQGAIQKNEKISLTGLGHQIVTDASLIRPLKREIWFPFDGLLRKPKWFGNTRFLKPKEAKDMGIPQLKAIPARGPEIDELSPSEVTEVMRLAVGAKRGEKDVLRIVSIEKRFRRYLPSIALVYRAIDSDDIQLGFAVDGRLSQEHELAFARGGGLERQQIFDGLRERHEFEADNDLLGGKFVELVQEANAKRKGLSSVTSARRELEQARVRNVVAQSDAERNEANSAESVAREKLSTAESAVRQAFVRPLPVYEHAQLMQEGLRTANSRLLIVSPWIRSAVVDVDFLHKIRQACDRGVHVSIGYGLGEGDSGEKRWDREARKELETMNREVSLFQLKRLGDTHAKILVKDSAYFVITSFNWLSFRGDPSMPFREEWGTIVRDPTLVDEFYHDIARRFLSD